MKKNFTLTVLSFVLVSICALAQTTPVKRTSPKPKSNVPLKTEPKMDSKVKQEDDMKTWMAYMIPGQMHEMMSRSNGEWKQEVTFWMKPGEPPTHSTATCTNSMIMGNRYQESVSKGDINGMPFEGRNVLGYDNAKKVFVSTWIDNMGTGIMYMEGPWDEKNKTAHFTGKSVDPMTGKDLHVREEFKLIDDNNQMMEMYTTQNGKEYKSMEIKFSR